MISKFGLAKFAGWKWGWWSLAEPVHHCTSCEGIAASATCWAEANRVG